MNVEKIQGRIFLLQSSQSAVDDALYFLVWHSGILTQSDCIKHEVRWLVIDRPFELVLARSNLTIQAWGFVFGPTHGDSWKIPARELWRKPARI